jgi:Domain of unknown function (DUF1905)
MADRTSARNDSSTPAIRFEARAQRTGGSTVLRLPDDASAKLPSRGQVAVNGVMNGHAFQTVLEPDGRRGHWLKFRSGKRRPCCFDLAACTDPDLSKNGVLAEAM